MSEYQVILNGFHIYDAFRKIPFSRVHFI